MVFGLGKKKKEDAPVQAQMSPEAMAMLTQMAQSGGAAQAQPMAPSMPAPGTAQVSAAGLTQLPTVATAAAVPDTTKPGRAGRGHVRSQSAQSPSNAAASQA